MTKLLMLHERVIKIVEEESDRGSDRITPDSVLQDDVTMDSLQMVEMVMRIEEEFDIELEDDELSPTMRVRDIIDLVNNKVTELD